LGTFLDLAQMPQFKNLKILLVTPSDPKEYLANLEKDLVDRITCVVGKSISKIDFCAGDLRLYPANYGANSQFAKRVSINVLEMACLGVPSLMTISQVLKSVYGKS
jgi:hypothetical protein